MPQHPDLVTGQLKNGLRYVILPNKTPPNRFEAHLEVHAGSVDELQNQQVDHSLNRQSHHKSVRYRDWHIWSNT